MQVTLPEPAPPARMSDFLARNPFPRPYTFGFFYREKMRAIRRITPDVPVGRVLEVGGGQSGLSAMLFPGADVVNLDLEGSFATAPCNVQPRVCFVQGDATDLPFDDDTFDAVTMFDLIEHVPDDRSAMREAFRVLRPGGYLLVSTPNETWRFPYYGFMKPFCPTEEEMFAEWGHVRRGYSLDQLEDIIPMELRATATFISPVTVLCHDVAFSRLGARLRWGICMMLSPLTWLGYALHRSSASGTETASAWQKSV